MKWTYNLDLKKYQLHDDNILKFNKNDFNFITDFQLKKQNLKLKKYYQLKNVIIKSKYDVICRVVGFNEKLYMYLCEFYDNDKNIVKCWVESDLIHEKRFKHPYVLRYDFLKQRYRHMVERCSSKSKFYGSVYDEYTLSKSWSGKLGFITYIYDVINKPNFDEDMVKNGKLQLDKDYKNNPNKEYSKNTTTWLTPKQNSTLSNTHSHILYDCNNDIRIVGTPLTLSVFTNVAKSKINSLSRKDRMSTSNFIGKKYNVDCYNFLKYDLNDNLSHVINKSNLNKGISHDELINKINNSSIIFLDYYPNI